MQIVVSSAGNGPERLRLVGRRKELLAEFIRDDLVAIAMDNQHGRSNILHTTHIVESPHEGWSEYREDSPSHGFGRRKRRLQDNSSACPLRRQPCCDGSAYLFAVDDDLLRPKTLAGDEVVGSQGVSIQTSLAWPAVAFAIASIIQEEHGRACRDDVLGGKVSMRDVSPVAV